MTDDKQTVGQVTDKINPDPSQPITTPTGEGTETQQQPQYVTKEELDGFAAELLSRVKQSSRDRAKAVDDKLNEIKGLLTKAGTQVTPEQERVLRVQIDEGLDVAPAPAEGSAPQATPNPVDLFLNDVFAEVGVTISPNDPEWKTIQAKIDETWDDPKGYSKVVLAVNQAAEAKKQRTATMQESAPARVGGSGSTPTGLPANVPASDLWKKAYGG